MKIETKHNIYDIIYFIHEKKVCSSKVRKIKVEFIGNPPITIDTEITYLCCKDDDQKNVFIKVDEGDAFKTKESLLKSL